MFARSYAPVERNLRRQFILSSACRSSCSSQQSLCLRRSLWTPTFQAATDGFLDLALALPYPLPFPPYASTIILTTVLSRAFLTLPFSAWAKKRQWRLEEEVLPELLRYRNEQAKRIAQEMKNAGLAKGGLEQVKKTHADRLRRAVEKRRKELFALHSCAPLPTMLIPALTQLPLFMLSTIFFSSLSVRPTPLDDESFLTLTSLARPDPTAALPIALGFVTLANVETAGWFAGEERAAREARAKEKAEEEERKKLEQGVPVLPSVKNMVQGGLRIFSVARIVIGVMVDGSVIVYWLASATFGLFQSWGFNWWDARRLVRRSALEDAPLGPKKFSKPASKPR